MPIILAPTQEHACERDRQYAEKLACEINGANNAAASHQGSGAAQTTVIGSPGSSASSQVLSLWPLLYLLALHRLCVKQPVTCSVSSCTKDVRL